MNFEVMEDSEEELSDSSLASRLSWSIGTIVWVGESGEGFDFRSVTSNAGMDIPKGVVGNGDVLYEAFLTSLTIPMTLISSL
jgi:hypothetical protein